MEIVIGVLSLLVGISSGYYLRQIIAKKQLNTAEGKASKIIEEAEKRAQEALIEAKGKAVNILEEAKKWEMEREKQIIRSEERLEKKELALDKETEELERGRTLLEKKADEVRQIKKEAEETRAQELKRLEKIAGLSKEEAKNILLQLTEEENKDLIARRIKDLEANGQEELNKKARDIMTGAIQKYAGSHSADVTTSIVSIPSDEVKGRIIGREGRNIKALERLTGIEIIVDDTPEAIVISGFDPIRRETAKVFQSSDAHLAGVGTGDRPDQLHHMDCLRKEKRLKNARGL